MDTLPETNIAPENGWLEYYLYIYIYMCVCVHYSTYVYEKIISISISISKIDIYIYICILCIPESHIYGMFRSLFICNTYIVLSNCMCIIISKIMRGLCEVSTSL